ncbi:hypothetical protein CLPU_1c02270 [Gottschalkia purinilytica]|uniref:Phage protein n=1 Tax=Gottschalkia purinilytica TaxID=1503 RepID=A0A0L0WF02_GOTPU|nr:hypothetical protein [Gottschalkia purinilytica]KNF10062.1 hypothetical protein CLPU_1c02270 [Gottschalkia purinilytica]
MSEDANLLEETYLDRATIIRKVKYRKANGSIGFKDEIKSQDVKCKISKREVIATTQTDTTNIAKYLVDMVCDSNVDIQGGDKVEITFFNDIKRSYFAGEPFFYTTHLEVPLERKERL